MRKLNSKNLLNSKVFCILPWVNLQIGTTGDIRLCCLSNSEEFNLGNISKINFEKGFNNEKIVKIRKDILRGKKIVNCNECYKKEKYGSKSLRVYNIENNIASYSKKLGFKKEELLDNIKKQAGYWDKPLIHLDIKPGNACNLKCRMCGPSSSNKIIRKKEKTKNLDWLSEEKNLNKIKKILENVEFLKIGGGEPSVMKNVEKILDYCVDNNLSKNIILQVTTNGTNIKSLSKYKNKFKKYKIIFSIDAIEHVYDYIRFPAKWDLVEKNFIEILNSKSIDIGINTIFMIINAYYFSHNFLPWLNKMSKVKEIEVDIILLSEPSYYNSLLLPLASRNFIVSNIKREMKKFKYISKKTKNSFFYLTKVLLESKLEDREVAMGLMGFIRESRK